MAPKPQAGPKMDLEAHLSVWRRSRNDGVRELKGISHAVGLAKFPRPYRGHQSLVGQSWCHVGAMLGPSWGASWGHLGVKMHRFRASSILRPSWLLGAILRAILGLLGPLGAILGPSWCHLLVPLGATLGPSWATLGPPWGHLGAILGPLDLEAILGPLGSSWGHLGSIFLGPSRGQVQSNNINNASL